MGDVSGTLRKASLDGITFRAAMDINVNLQTSPYENEGIPTTGRTMLKKTLRNPNAEGVTFVVNPAEQELLRGFSERLKPFPISFELADGSVYRTDGWIDFPGVETEENKTELVVIPDRSIDAWALFAAA